MGCSRSLRFGIFASWLVAATISFAPASTGTSAGARNAAIASLRIRSNDGSCNNKRNGTRRRLVHFDATASSTATRSGICVAKNEATNSSPAEKVRDEAEVEINNNVPGIQKLRNNLRKWSKASSPEAPIEATNVLNTMFRLYRSNNSNNGSNSGQRRNHRQRRNSRPVVDAIDCTQVINAWSKSRRRDAPQQALAILKEMIETFENDEGNSNPSTIRPDGVTYNSVTNAFARRGDFNGASAVFAMQTNDFKKKGNAKAKPDVYTFTTMINACSRCKSNKSNNNQSNNPRKGVSETAEKLLTTMQDWHARGDLEHGPSVVTYNTVINCFSKSNAQHAPERARNILESMVSRYESESSNTSINANANGGEVVRPNAITYNSVLNAYARQGDVEGATEVFEMMKNDFRSGNTGAKPQVQTYNILINAWSKSNKEDAPQQAESLLKEIVRTQSEGKFEHGEGPDIITYSAVINCYSKSRARDGPSRARKLLETMVSEYENGGKKDIVRPDKVVYGAVMNAHARQGDTKGATEVFEMMKNDYYSGNNNAEPSVPSYNILIDAWSKSNMEDAPRQAELLLKEMIKMHSEGDLKEGPDTITYGAVINCYSKSNLHDAPRRARNLLETMIAQCQGDDTKKDVRPNMITYAAVMDAHARQGDVQGATEVFEMLKQDRNCEPNVQTYTILIDAWSKSNTENAPLEAALLLKEMVGMGPAADGEALKKGQESKSNTLRKDSLSRARDILSEMDARYDRWNKTIRPDTVTYNAVMNAFARQGDVEGATGIFEMMEKDSQSGMNRNARMDDRTYNILLDAWAKSGRDSAVAESERILNEMYRRCDNGEFHKRPDAVTYRTMIRCLEQFEGTGDRIEELKVILSSTA